MKEYKTISMIKGPLIFVEKTEPVGYADMVKIQMSNGDIKNGQVLDTSDEIVVVQVFEGTAGIDVDSRVKFLGDTLKLSRRKDWILSERQSTRSQGLRLTISYRPECQQLTQRTLLSGGKSCHYSQAPD